MSMFIDLKQTSGLELKLDIKSLVDYAIDAEIINISEGGLLMELRDIRSPNAGEQTDKASFFFGDLLLKEQLVWLQFRLPTDPSIIQAIGKPAWMEKPESPNSGLCLLGIQFTELTPQSRRSIAHFIYTRLKQLS